VLLEAAACGRPVIATDVPGCREAVVDGETGRLVPPADPEALAAAIAELAGDPGRCREMGERGRRRVAAELSTARVVADTLEVYRRAGVDVGPARE
jgi:glycosyltransferase involved in cell wall biosynthesis